MLTFTFWDVQHGHACHIRTPNGRHIVIDLGIGSFGDGKSFSPLQYLRSTGAEVDYLVITHPHRDHIDDIENFDLVSPKLLNRPNHLTETEVRAGNKPTDSAKVDRYLEISNRYNGGIVPRGPLDLSTSPQWGGVQIQTFAPSRCNRSQLNNHSLVTILQYADAKVLIPGDNEAASWRELLENQQFVSAAKGTHILLAPHHGRLAGYSSELFEKIGKVKLTVISDGPHCDTSATRYYGNQSDGWPVHYADGSWETRYCVTTRCDGIIRIESYFARDGNAHLVVRAQRGSAAGSGFFRSLI